MNIKFLGSASALPNAGNDCPCFIINGKYLFDCGYSVVTSLWEANQDVSQIEYIIFTHMHHDHYIGLAGLLFYMLQSKKKNLEDLTIIGPSDVNEVLERTYSFLLLDKHFLDAKRPKVITINAGETISNDDFTLTAGSCFHPVDARCYRFTDKFDGKSLAITGDTALKTDMANLFRNADAIIHDCTLGTHIPTDDPQFRQCGHSCIYEALTLCEVADIPILFPVHMNSDVARNAIEAVKGFTKTKVMYPEKHIEFILY